MGSSARTGKERAAAVARKGREAGQFADVTYPGMKVTGTVADLVRRIPRACGERGASSGREVRLP